MLAASYRRHFGYALPLALAMTAIAQEPVFLVQGAQANDGLGRAVSIGGDWNTDGFADLAVGLPGVSSFAGAVELRSGFDGSLIRTIPAPPFAREFGSAIDARLDFNGDGVKDLVVGAPFADLSGTFLSPGAVYLINGATSAVMQSSTGTQDNDELGKRVLALGDVNGDGVPDFAAGGTGIDGPSMRFNCGGVRVFSGATGVALYTRFGWGVDTEYGASLTGLADVDGDLRPDWVSGGGGAYPSYVGRVELCSGATGTPIFTLNGTSLELAGFSVSRIRDLDNDGRDDFVLGKSGYRNTAGQFVGRVEARSGFDGHELFAVDGTPGANNLGQMVLGLGDLDGDLVPDFAAYRPPQSLLLYSGRTRTSLGSLICEPEYETGLSAGDANLGGKDDIAIGEEIVQGVPMPFAGRARLFAIADRFLSTSPSPLRMPGTLTLSFRGAVASSLYAIFITHANGTPIGPHAVVFGATDAAGRASLSVLAPVVPGLQSIDFLGVGTAPLPFSFALTNLRHSLFQ